MPPHHFLLTLHAAFREDKFPNLFFDEEFAGFMDCPFSPCAATSEGVSRGGRVGEVMYSLLPFSEDACGAAFPTVERLIAFFAGDGQAPRAMPVHGKWHTGHSERD
jgi:hypothetical protein